jgi:hypothetical protein
MNNDYTLYAFFNKKSRAFICFTFDVTMFPDNVKENFLIKEFSFKELDIPDEEINMARYRWIGDYDTGRLADIILEKKAVVTEREINEKYDAMLFDKFNIKDILYELILNSEMKTEKGKQIQERLQKILKKKESDIEFFKNSELHIWETQSDLKNQLQNAFKV